jgi:hypothetical protein
MKNFARVAGSTLAMTAGLGLAAGGTGVAQAQPDLDPPPMPSPVDQMPVDQTLPQTQTPMTLVNPSDEGGPATDWGGVGMYCENVFVQCS